MQSNARRKFLRRASARNRKFIRREALRKRAARRNLHRHGGRWSPFARAAVLVGYITAIGAVLLHVPNVLS